MIPNLLESITCTICSRWWEANNKKDDQLALPVLIFSIGVLAASFWYIWTSVKFRKAMASLPPGPRGLPIAGYLPFLGTNLHQNFTELAHRYGPIYKLWLGKKLCIVVSSSSLAKEVVRDQDINFANRDVPIAASVITYGGLDIVWSPYGSYWLTMRKLFVRKVLGNNNLDACYNLRKDEVRKTINDVYSRIGTAIDIGNIFFLTEFNVVMGMIWGSRLEGQKTDNLAAEFHEVASKIIVLLGKPNISDFFPMLARFDLQGVEREMKRLMHWVDRTFDTFTDERLKMETVQIEGALENEGRKDLLQILLELREGEDTAIPINRTQIKAILLDILIGGTDTTATMAVWVMAELLHNPEVMEKVRDELTAVVGMNNNVEESHLPKLQYLEAVVKETFRLHPAIPLSLPKRSAQSCIVGGYAIPKDTRVFINVWALHRDPQVWDNPSEFKPDRFLSCDMTRKYDYTGNSLEYLPFGSGRRICAGIPLAEKMLMYVLGSLLHSFEWNLPMGEELDLSETFGVVLKKRTPLIAIPSRRLSNSDLYA